MHEPMPKAGFSRIQCHRYGQSGPGTDRGTDRVVVEEPLELRVDGTPVVTVMRTPGHDRDLALGLLHSEAWIRSLRDIRGMVICGRGETAPLAAQARAAPTRPESDVERGNVVDLRLEPHVESPASRGKRLIAMSSCGVCGKRTIEDVLALAPPPDGSDVGPPDSLRCPVKVLTSLPGALRGHQPLFDLTGALHGAALFETSGAPLVAREDVGRHNAVDKVVGWALLAGNVPLSECILQVSGRVSFEIVQKAHRAGIPMIVAVSGVSTLAAQLADEAGITLVGFLRGVSFNVYSHPERIG